MNRYQKPIATAAILLALSIAAGARAETVSVLDRTSIGTAGRDEDGRAFTLASVTRAQPAAASASFATTQRAIALGKATPTGLVLGPGAAVSLWNFIACIQAQQRDRAFEHLEADLRHIEQLPKPTSVSAVPLPGSAWLLLMGMMGMIGARLTGHRTSPSSRLAAWLAVIARALHLPAGRRVAASAPLPRPGRYGMALGPQT